MAAEVESGSQLATAKISGDGRVLIHLALIGGELSTVIESISRLQRNADQF
jgi:hypothetical protein